MSKTKTQDAAPVGENGAPIEEAAAIVSPLFDTPQAAAYLKVSEAYLRLLRLEKHPTGPAYIQRGRRILYRRDDLDRWIEEGRVDPKIAFAEFAS